MKQEKIEELEKVICAEYGNIAGILVQKSGMKLYENYWNGYTAGHAVHVASVTKSVVSALIGIAIEQGYIENEDRKVLDFFPDYTVKAGERTIQNITIRNLLTMTAPYRYQTEPYEKFFTSRNPIRDALDLLGGDGAIGEFNYSAIGGTHILSGILVKATGRSVLDFAVENLFAPLEMKVPRNVVLRNKEEHIAVMNDKNTSGWAVDAQGINTAGWGLFLTAEDMAKIGRLYLNGGVWDGKQIVSAGWIAESTREHSRCAEWGNLAYGYLWWILDGDSYAALGDGGNVIYVNTKKKMVISIASLLIPDAKDRIELIQKYIEPIFQD
ncbi:6-aminohexanoate-dimer hydrolase [Caprobacter fermentans]|uniref:6-aminohexanoate-dimer hydrolase n=1 Tax=Caproicibacter fermentans TaxID=2576756 RepID=A0A6N8I2T5_9FIRM|nr:serine hydrolase [Caproicibacter fermentans]MVB12451.1 6-aminohexanoate-dimer hydrolase [Caproicibacter fermentans]QNK40546.1 serine hydrolase [Caproicibacter fermentans]